MAGPASRLHTSALASRSLAFSPTRHVASPGHPGFNSFAHRSIGRQANSASFSPAKKDQSLRKSLQIVAARTESADLPLGDTVPDFEVPQSLNERLCSMCALHLHKSHVHNLSSVALHCSSLNH